MVKFHNIAFSDSLLEAERLSLEAEIFICIGCSLEVQPAADLPCKALESGAYLIQVNPNVTKLDDFAHCNLRGNAGEILPLLWQAVCTNI